MPVRYELRPLFSPGILRLHLTPINADIPRIGIAACGIQFSWMYPPMINMAPRALMTTALNAEIVAPFIGATQRKLLSVPDVFLIVSPPLPYMVFR